VRPAPEPQVSADSRIIGPGDVLGRYELLLPVAAGGMAMVWAARLKGSRGFQKIVAVKTMLPKLSEDPQFEKMFLDEASLASRIHHPNVVEVLDLGEEAGVLFIAMEWLDGAPLNQVMKAAKTASGIPLPVAIHILTHAAEGLHAAHELRDDAGTLVGLVHRDVSPQNIIVGYDGFTKMVDFGLAKATALGDGATRAGQLKGKISYMAPEQVKGEPIDRRSDVFALGVVLYAVTTGKHPFRRESEGATLFAISAPDSAPAPSRFMEYPAPLEAVLMKAISKKPDDRYSSALEFARALEETLPEAERVHGGERVGAFVRTLLGTQHDQSRAALTEAMKRADRMSLAPPGQAPLEGLNSTGASGVSSLSAVGLAVRPNGFDAGSTTDLLRPPTPWERARLPLGLVLMAVGVGAAAYAITRTATQQDPPPSVAVTPPAPSPSPIPTSVATEPSAPRVGLDALPVDSSAPPSEVTMEPTPEPTTGRGAGKGTPRAGSTAAPNPTGTTVRKKPSWRQDPGF
jgi:eukaryotic-like serine/threonine-protein kinase